VGETIVAVKVTVCVGSSCHIRGSRELLKRFDKIIKDEGLDREVALTEVTLYGSFCMDRCGESMNWRFQDEDISSTNVDEAEATLRNKLAEVTRDL
jgi:NADH:ubiquinone oxidoreductase subunit E